MFCLYIFAIVFLLNLFLQYNARKIRYDICGVLPRKETCFYCLRFFFSNSNPSWKVHWRILFRVEKGFELILHSKSDGKTRVLSYRARALKFQKHTVSLKINNSVNSYTELLIYCRLIRYYFHTQITSELLPVIIYCTATRKGQIRGNIGLLFYFSYIPSRKYV